MNIKRIFANAVARRVAYVLVAAALAWLGFGGSAGAQDLTGRCPQGNYPYTNRPCDQGQAYAEAQRLSEAWREARPDFVALARIDHVPTSEMYEAICSRNSYPTETGCGAAFYRPDSACSTRPVMTTGWSRNSSVCDSGCGFTAGGGLAGTTMTIAGHTYRSMSGWAPTGNVCGGGEGAALNEDDCVQDGTLTQCVTKEGKHCAVASSGKKFCWNASEAGVKSSGNEGATKSPQSATINAPSTPPKNGGDWTQSGQGSSSTTTNNTTTNYNITNFASTYGSDGSGGGSGDGEGEGEGEGEEGSASGGGDCEARPVVSDPMLEMVATQAWATRCAVEAGNAANVTGDIGDCDSAFSVEGDTANAHKLRAMRAQICGAGSSDDFAGIDGDIDTMLSEFDSVFQEPEEVEISASRYGGGGGCPAVNVAMPWGGTWTLPPEACSVIAALRLLFLAVAGIWAIQIVRG